MLDDGVNNRSITQYTYNYSCYNHLNVITKWLLDLSLSLLELFFNHFVIKNFFLNNNNLFVFRCCCLLLLCCCRQQEIMMAVECSPRKHKLKLNTITKDVSVVICWINTMKWGGKIFGQRLPTFFCTIC